MDNIAILTSQNIAIEQTPASVGERILASVIDYAFCFAYMMLMLLFSGIIDNTSTVFMLFVFGPPAFYHFVSEMAMDGQSWGKKIVKIKVVKIDGTEADFVTTLIRWIFRIVDIWFLFGSISCITVILNKKGQRLGDMAANTTVIRLKEKEFTETLYTSIPKNYVPLFSQVFKLSDSDIYTARDVIEYLTDSYSSEQSIEMAQKAKTALSMKMGVDSELSPEKFLQAVIKDYNYIHSR
ncbi:MAG TPA: RDD family protein [Bacteroidales bacterium]|nr:RDD family protein [Bacteroidales bacterium]